MFMPDCDKKRSLNIVPIFVHIEVLWNLSHFRCLFRKQKKQNTEFTIAWWNEIGSLDVLWLKDLSITMSNP